MLLTDPVFRSQQENARLFREFRFSETDFLHRDHFLAQSEVNVPGGRGAVNTQELCKDEIPVGEKVHLSASQEKLESKWKAAQMRRGSSEC